MRGRLQVGTLMRRMGIEARYRKPRTSIPAREGSIYPYLLGGVSIERPNQVWSTDITYIPMAHGFLYLMAIMDIASRKVLAWRLSNTLTTDFCLAALEEALARYGAPEIFNSDQGSQFTSEDWLERLKGTGFRISMDGKGRWIDNVFIERLWRSVKYEDIYLYSYRGMATKPDSDSPTIQWRSERKYEHRSRLRTRRWRHRHLERQRSNHAESA